MSQPDKIESDSHWMSIGDLMSGLMMIFALLVAVAMLMLSERVEQSQKNRIFVIQSITEQLNADGIQAEINPETGDITILDNILFSHNSSKMTEDGETFLERFIPVYSRGIYKNPEAAEEVVRVLVEGYSSSVGDIGYNMTLSLERANAVMSGILGMDFTHKNDFLKKLTISGRGEAEASQEQALAEDRKVMFRLQFKGTYDEAIRLLK
jgi:outer membrane protein OmpA-like peptidoglycan-associated protein